MKLHFSMDELKQLKDSKPSYVKVLAQMQVIQQQSTQLMQMSQVLVDSVLPTSHSVTTCLNTVEWSSRKMI